MHPQLLQLSPDHWPLQWHICSFDSASHKQRPSFWQYDEHFFCTHWPLSPHASPKQTNPSSKFVYSMQGAWLQSQDPVCTLHDPGPPQMAPTPVLSSTPGQLFSQNRPQYPGMHTHVESAPARSSRLCSATAFVNPEQTPLPRKSTTGTPHGLHCPPRS